MKNKRRGLREAKAEMIAKKRRLKRRKRTAFLFIEIFLLLILLGVVYAVQKFEKIQSDSYDSNEIETNDGIEQEGYTTIVLFGGDSREGHLEAGAHADTMMIVSIDNKTKDIRIASVYRDTPMRQKDGEILKANSAYFMGGPQEAINMLNRNLDLDIKDYATVDFSAMAVAIDMLGGLELDVSEEEADEMNRHIGDTAKVTGKEAVYVSAGTQVLDGVQSVTYSRIRKNVGGDYMRTERQRIVIGKIVEKVKKSDLATINDIIDAVFEKVSTSFTMSEIIKLAAGVMQYDMKGTSGFPFERIDGKIDGVGSVVVPLGMVENVEELHEFLYPGKEYQPSETIHSIAADIEYLTGYTRADYVEQ